MKTLLNLKITLLNTLTSQNYQVEGFGLMTLDTGEVIL